MFDFSFDGIGQNWVSLWGYLLLNGLFILYFEKVAKFNIAQLRRWMLWATLIIFLLGFIGFMIWGAIDPTVLETTELE